MADKTNTVQASTVDTASLSTVAEEAGMRAGWPLAIGWAFGIAALVALVVFVLHISDLEVFLSLVRQADPIWLLAALGFQLLTYVTAAIVWKVVLARAGCRLPFTSLLKIGFLQLFANQILPTSGLSGTIIVLHALTARGVDAAVALSGLFLDALTYYAVYLALAVFAFALVWHRHVNGFDALPLLVAFVALMAGLLIWLALMSRWRERMLPSRLLRFKPMARLAVWMREMNPETVRHFPTLATAAICQCAVFLLDAATLWAVARAIGFPLGPMEALASFLIASVVATLAPLPLGLGSFEGSSTMALHVFGAGAEAGLAATLILRGLTLWLPMVPGLIITRLEITRRRSTK